MSTSKTPTGRPDKTMSSRLLTMKFMQRAAASSPPSSPANPSEPSLKRRKTSNGPSPATTHITDTQAFRDAADADDAKRTAAVEKLAAEAGETKWVLSTADVNAGPTNETAPQRKLRFLRAGYSDIDQDTAQLTGKGWGEMGRRSFGRFNRDIEKQENGGATSDSSPLSSADSKQEHGDDTYSSDSANITEDTIDPTEALQRAKADRKGKKKAEKAEAARLAEHHRSKEVRLNRLSSISGGGAGGAGIECHCCGQKGHKKADCPKNTTLKRRREGR